MVGTFLNLSTHHLHAVLVRRQHPALEVNSFVFDGNAIQTCSEWIACGCSVHDRSAIEEEEGEVQRVISPSKP